MNKPKQRTLNINNKKHIVEHSAKATNEDKDVFFEKTDKGAFVVTFPKNKDGKGVTLCLTESAFKTMIAGGIEFLRKINEAE